MSKKRAGESLTGGTGDVNPQYLHGLVTQSGADATTTSQFALPIQKVQSGGKQATIIELLKVFVDFPTPSALGAAQQQQSMELNFSTISFGTTQIQWSEPNCFAKASRIQGGAFTATGSMLAYDDAGPYCLDLTDGAGHGILIATDNIFAQAFSTGSGNTNTMRFKLLYRFKKVGLLEYIGIVQAQQ